MASITFGLLSQIVTKLFILVMSRGRGIRCFNNIYDITDYCLGGTGQFVIQKYIEHPLVI